MPYINFNLSIPCPNTFRRIPLIYKLGRYISNNSAKYSNVKQSNATPRWKTNISLVDQTLRLVSRYEPLKIEEKRNPRGARKLDSKTRKPTKAIDPNAEGSDHSLAPAINEEREKKKGLFASRLTRLSDDVTTSQFEPRPVNPPPDRSSRDSCCLPKHPQTLFFNAAFSAALLVKWNALCHNSTYESPRSEIWCLLIWPLRRMVCSKLSCNKLSLGGDSFFLFLLLRSLYHC